MVKIKDIKILDTKNDYLILGLHACGDLSSTILKHFVENKNVKVLVSVSCCYHKLNNGSDRLYREELNNFCKGYGIFLN